MLRTPDPLSKRCRGCSLTRNCLLGKLFCHYLKEDALAGDVSRWLNASAAVACGSWSQSLCWLWWTAGRALLTPLAVTSDRGPWRAISTCWAERGGGLWSSLLWQECSNGVVGMLTFQKKQTREVPRSVVSLQIKAMCAQFDLSAVLRGGWGES